MMVDLSLVGFVRSQASHQTGSSSGGVASWTSAPSCLSSFGGGRDDLSGPSSSPTDTRPPSPASVTMGTVLSSGACSHDSVMPWVPSTGLDMQRQDSTGFIEPATYPSACDSQHQTNMFMAPTRQNAACQPHSSGRDDISVESAPTEEWDADENDIFCDMASFLNHDDVAPPPQKWPAIEDPHCVAETICNVVGDAVFSMSEPTPVAQWRL